MSWQHLKSLQFSDLPLDDVDRKVLNDLAQRLQDNYPYNQQNYAGQMIKPPHTLAQAAYWMSTFVNPNNHALDGGRATSALELEIMADLAKMIGYQQSLGHLTSGGTMANLEALWVARQCQSKATVIASSASHYTHSRMSEVLGMPFKSVATSSNGAMDIEDLEKVVSNVESAVVVVTMGTTGLGRVDPLSEILDLQKTYNFRIHIDAAYGGYFKIANLKTDTKRHFELMHRADSVVIDPHKHGLQPYGCGAILLKNSDEGRFYKHDSPYTYFTSGDLHLGEITLECSRPGAASGALWATMQKFPLEQGGAFSQRLDESLLAARGLHKCAESLGYLSIEPELDICIFSKKGKRSSEMSQENRAFFDRKAKEGIHLALLKIKKENCSWPLEWDTEELVVVRSVLMKPEHNDPEFWNRLLN
jgi:glutamate/tyrosine decarboxylase-like PLP-dependent enzyme